VDVKRSERGTITVHVDRGRRDTGEDPVTWAKRACDLGAGEILFNSIDHDGARKGYDLQTLSRICDTVDVPVIAFGGVFTWRHLVEGIAAGADAVAAANIFHYSEHATRKAKAFMAEAGVLVRREGRELT
jgi:cyclase